MEEQFLPGKGSSAVDLKVIDMLSDLHLLVLEQVLIWGETEITHIALSRKRYILLKYREVWVRKFLKSWKNNFVPDKGSSAVDLKVIYMLSDLHLLVLEELREQALAQGLKWTRTSAEDISDQPAGETDGVKAVAADVDATAEKIDEQVAEPSADVETSVGESFEPALEVPDEETRPSSADDVDFIIKKVIEDTALMGPAEENQEVDASADRDQPAATTEERHWFDLPYEDLMARFDAERKFFTASDTDEDIEQVDVFTDEEIEAERPSFGTDVGNVQLQSVDEDQQVQFSVEEPSAYEAMYLEYIMLSIPLDISFPSAGMEVTKITLGKTIKIPGVDARTLHLDNLTKISADDKGKKILVEKDPVKGNPAKEHYFLICADIDLLVNLRAQVIEAVDQFFHSFSFKKLATINIEELSRKEEQVLIWGETEITHIALSRKRYILLKYREVWVRKFLKSWKNNFVPDKGSSAVDLKVIYMLSDLHLLVLEELREQALAQGLKWTRTYASITTSFGDFGELEEELEEAAVRCQLVFRPIGSSIQVVLSSFRFELLWTPVVEACIEDERQYRAPYLPAGLVVSRYETNG
ncbi:hypothetical protein F511_36178 [Dorcoceras hygrometricum]|uniref:Uncharacterized protein n=1 Tax=Dorcoceras hygrometricum TaxID=472368 RepID=A0A2Z7C729_9LAMI|nr:hypothetical protein F511_36178 [Dorcoceras hygrometricum]